MISSPPFLLSLALLALSQTLSLAEDPPSNQQDRPVMRKIAALEAEVERLNRRIAAGDMAGEKLEAMLAEVLQDRAPQVPLEAQLDEARALAEREHQRAEQISAEVLEKVAAQIAVGEQLQETISGVAQEREELLAKLEASQTEQQELAAENEKLSQSLKLAWEKSKLSEKHEREIDEAVEEQRIEKAQLERENTQLEDKLEASLASQRTLEKQIEALTAEQASLEEKAIEQRAAALRERIMRKRAETQLDDSAARQKTAKASATNAGDAAARAIAAANAAAARPIAAAEASVLAAEAASEQEAAVAEEAALLDITPIYFGKNEADSEAQERSLLAQVAQIHQRLPEARFTITGHTCTDGSAAGNLALSQRRAQHIAELLKENGIPAGAIAGVIGKGQTSPIADNATQLGRETNRRVEIEVLRD